MRKLPAFKAMGHAIRSTTDNIGFAFHISWPWMLMLLPFNVATNLYLVLNGLETAGEPNPAMLGKYFAVATPLLLASVIAYASIAVNWHRYVLRDEIAQGWQRLRIDSLMWRYIGNFTLIFLVLMACAIPLGVAFVMIGFLTNAVLGEETVIVFLILAIAVFYVFAFVVGYRLMVKLPAVALGRSDFSMGDAWRATKGNSWRLRLAWHCGAFTRRGHSGHDQLGGDHSRRNTAHQSLWLFCRGQGVLECGTPYWQMR